MAAANSTKRTTTLRTIRFIGCSVAEAAEIAAYHSKARDAKLVPVDYTYVKNLKKPQGAPYGKVIYHVYYSVNVTPDRDKINAKLSKVK